MKKEKNETIGVNKAILNYEFAMERYLEAKDVYEEAQYALRDFFEGFDPVNLEEESYEMVRDFSKNMDRFCRNDELKNQVKAIKEKKMIQKYPKLLLSHFYPEINNLDIPMEDKMRLDKVLRKNHGYYISKTTFRKLGFKSFDELELLKSIGLVEKFYEVRCPECWERIDLVSEDKLHDLMNGEYLDYYTYCDNCNLEWYIEDKKEFESKFFEMPVIYKIVKMPDLWSEKI